MKRSSIGISPTCRLRPTASPSPRLSVRIGAVGSALTYEGGVDLSQNPAKTARQGGATTCWNSCRPRRTPIRPDNKMAIPSRVAQDMCRQIVDADHVPDKARAGKIGRGDPLQSPGYRCHPGSPAY